MTIVMTKKRKLAILRRMRELLGKRGGWIQGAYHNDEGGSCLLGAGSQAASEVLGKHVTGGQFGVDLAPKISLTEAAKKRGFSGLWQFNDSPKRKKKEVLALLDDKIAELEKS